jgi:hypothetical protein
VDVALGDFNGDGNLDAVARGFNPPLAILLGDGKGGFGPGFSSFAGVSSTSNNGNQSIVVADFNGDGKPDIACSATAANSVSVFLNQTVPWLRIAGLGPVQLTWPDWAGYRLESTTNLFQASSWVAVTNAPSVVRGQRMLTLNIDAAARFFRLAAL